jgi:4-carboxymuconolactone decarboxylase
MARVPYAQRESLPQDAQAVYDHVSATWGRVPRPFQLLFDTPKLVQQLSDMLKEVHESTVVDREVREIAILTVARELDFQFEWTYHEASARKAGLRDVVIEGIKSPSAKGLLPKEQVFVDYAKQVMRGRVNDPTYAAVEHLLGQRGAVELTVLIGYYTMFCSIGSALKLELPDGMQPLLPGGR